MSTKDQIIELLINRPVRLHNIHKIRSITSRSEPIELKELEAGIVVLERFSECVSIYANWWNEMCMTEISQKQRLESVIFKYNSLREKAVIGTWRQLKQEYVDYSNKVLKFLLHCWVAPHARLVDHGSSRPIPRIHWTSQCSRHRARGRGDSGTCQERPILLQSRHTISCTSSHR